MMDDLIKDVGNNAAAQLRSYVERVEKLIEERKGIQDDIKDVMAEVKATGFDVKTVRIVIRERAKDAAKREEERALVDTYLSALGLL